MTERVIPLTPPGPLWSQREYVECMRLGIGFAAHRASDTKDWFHYGFPEGIGCTSVLISGDAVRKYVDHSFSRTHDWIDRCRTAVA